MQVLGKQLIIEYHECDVSVIDDVKSIEKALLDAARVAGATVISSSFHRFEPHGISGVVIISESHLTIHTWPEYNYAAVDIFTCGERVNPEASYEYLKDIFKTRQSTCKTILRGPLLSC